MIRDERLHSDRPNTLPIVNMIAICQLYDQTVEIFEKIKFIEGIYYKHLVDSYNEEVEKIKRQNKTKNRR